MIVNVEKQNVLYTIRFSGGTDPDRDRLFSLLERMLPVTFECNPRLQCESDELVFEAVVTTSGTLEDGEALYRLRLPRRRSDAATRGLVERNIRFPHDPRVPFPFAGRSIWAQIEPNVLSISGAETVLATANDQPIWTVARQKAEKEFRAALALPLVGESTGLHGVLNGDRFVELLPLLHWLRQVTSASAYEGPSPRACFIFDDPNLHWPTYGWVDYQKIVADAEKENFHIAFATIPLDTWFTNQRTAAIFRSNPQRLSLVFHGNNHVKRELGREYSPSARASLVTQAIHRMERLERSSGIQVDRVMVPPHGACSEDMLAALQEHGFESACISHGSLRAYNQSKPWTKFVGGLPSEWVRGCPVLPRWGLTGNVNNTVLLAAFLKQPIILRGHHQDLKAGVDVLNQFARLINSLGPIRWSNMAELSRMNYRHRIDGDLWRLKPLGRIVLCDVPSGVTRVQIESPVDCTSSWVILGQNGEEIQAEAGEIVSVPSRAGNGITVALRPPAAPLSQPDAYRFSTSALVRRLLTEGRDRFLNSL